ncbi:hypothetical protein [Prescottella equi]|uniref:hypothetical protein n=1 Tax=Rhodococcus hoagii TaxID=43767 RepID=UPI000A6D5823|nr:hypothetical protein [Prescottella equi]
MGKKLRGFIVSVVVPLGFLAMFTFAGLHQFWGLPQFAADRFVSIFDASSDKDGE